MSDACSIYAKGGLVFEDMMPLFSFARALFYGKFGVEKRGVEYVGNLGEKG